MTRSALVLVAMILLAACGSSSSGSGGAQGLLQQTFTGAHRLTSGRVELSISLSPSGSTVLRGPITVSLGGPFQSLGRGHLPASDFTVALSALGRSGSLSVISTGTHGYVSLGSTSYALPATTYQKLEQSFAGLASPTSGSGSSSLARLGINPLHWLRNPSVVGSAQVGGAQTTHIRAGVDVASLLNDLNTFSQHASAAGVSAAGRLRTVISPATRQRIAGEVRNPTLDVWTGQHDHLLRRLDVRLTLPVSGQLSTALGGLRAAGIEFAVTYAGVNRPQTITAPTALHPYAEFQTKLNALLAQVQGAAAGLTGGSTSASAGSSAGTLAPGSSAASGGSSANGGAAGASSAYGTCVTAAGSDVLKLQRCASLLGNG